MIARGVNELWPDLRGERLLGLGYVTPYLEHYRGNAERVIAFMPAGQGVLHWPRVEKGLVSLVDETDLPLADSSIDRVLLVHALESSEHLRAMLREIWRVLSGNGRLLVVVPSRRGIWARIDRTPFGWGHPYSTGQLSRVLRDHLFTPAQTQRALFIPPLRSRALLRAAPAWEQACSRWFPTFAGVVLVEASKQLYAVTPQHQKARKRPVLVALPNVARRIQPREG